MCGRFALPMDVSEIVEAFSTRPPANDFAVATPAYNICPTQTIPVIRNQAGEREIISMRWGFLPHWYKAGGFCRIGTNMKPMGR